MSPLQALQAYYEFATRRIADAVGSSDVAADALYALGKLYMTSAPSDASGKPMDQARAIVMFQAALSADASEFRSANELGVLLARNGKWSEAKALFTRSLRVQPSPEAWRNLARTHAELGETHLARQAENECRLLEGQSENVLARSGSLQWVTPDELAVRGAAADAPSEVAETPTGAQADKREPASPGSRLTGLVKKLF
jgi:predicted Zn-dependent protease